MNSYGQRDYTLCSNVQTWSASHHNHIIIIILEVDDVCVIFVHNLLKNGYDFYYIISMITTLLPIFGYSLLN